MTLDFTRFNEFWRSPERYRLIYECNLVPATKDYGLQRGIAFHLIKELSAKGYTQSQIDTALVAEAPDHKARAAAWAMWQQWLQRYNPHGPTSVAQEVEWMQQIPGSPHSMAGRIDELLDINGVQWVGEVKTANAKTTLVKVQQRWATDKQAEFVLVGAQALGYRPQGVLVRTIVEKKPPIIWELTTTRTPLQLQQLQLAVHQTCEIVEMLKANVGIDQPWPHLEPWPCCQKGRCEYESICKLPSSCWSTSELARYVRRTEHLHILSTAAKASGGTGD